MDIMALANKVHCVAAAACGLAGLAMPLNAGAANTAATQSPWEILGGLPTLESVVISPNGKRLAFVKTNGETRAIYAVEFGKSDLLGGVKVSETKLRDLEWVDDDNLLATVSITSLPPFGFIGPKREWSEMYVFDVTKRKLRPLSFAVDNQQTLNTFYDGFGGGWGW